LIRFAASAAIAGSTMPRNSMTSRSVWPRAMSDLADERAAARARLDDPEELERAERLADGRARDLELLRQSALGGELVTGVELTLLEQRLDLLDDALIEPASPYGLDRRQLRLPSVG
jgi:hypothetical protein